jgi:hypothetical protein
MTNSALMPIQPPTLPTVAEAWRIVFRLTCYDFPWDIEKALELALFRSFAVPRISQLLAKTGEFTQRTQKRYDDTELILYEILENGFDSPRAKQAIQRMNAMHRRFAISQEDYLYVLSTFVCEPVRWLQQFGWRSLTPKEVEAFAVYYAELGKYMGIKAIPKNFAEFDAYNRDYEQAHFAFSPDNVAIANATRDLFLGFYLPKWLWFLGKPVIYSLLDPPLLKNFGYPQAPDWLVFIVRKTLYLRANWLKLWPKRHKPVFGTQRKRKTYPQGYSLDDLGTKP